MVKMKKIFIMLVSSLLILSFLTPVFGQEEVEQKTVKVGFFNAEGYHIKDKNNVMKGYGYDFLQMMLRYNDWQYEYIGYENNWPDMLNMLDSGEIDMVTLANKTPERQEKYEFSDKPIGSSSTILTISSNNNKIIPGDFATYNGAVIGEVKNSSHNAYLQQYASEKGFNYTTIYYENIDDLLKDLRENKNIDIALTSNMRVLSDETVLGEFNATDYYVMVKKGNKELLDEINDGISQLDVYSSNWKNLLYEKYYDNINSKVIALSVDERTYLKQLKDNKKVIKAAINPELNPYAYFENGEAKGIAVVLFKEIAKRLNIEYEILYAKDRFEYKEQLSSKEADIDLTAFLDYSLAQNYNLKETDSYITSSMAMISRKNSIKDQKNMTIAMLKDPTEYIGYNEDFLSKYDYKEYNSITECNNAVKNGEVDATFCYVYIGEKAVNDDFSNSLQYTIMPNYGFDLAIGVINDEDHRLLSILNKGVNSLSESYKQGILVKESSSINKNDSIISLIYDYPVIIILVLLLLAGITITTLIMYIKNKSQKEKLRSSKEMERFIEYMCQSYETVAEHDLVKGIRIIYSIENGVLEKEIRKHIPFNREYFEPLVKPEDLTRMVENFSDETVDKLIKSGKEIYFEIQIRDRSPKDHDILLDTFSWYSYTIRGVPKDKWHPRNFVVFEKQIQQAKINEEKQKELLKDALQTAKLASEAKGHFLSRMSHEIRTPLNAVIGYMDIAKDSSSNPSKMMHCIENSDIAAKHLLSIINDVLDISSIESGRLKIAHQEFNLKDQLTNITTIFHNQAKNKGVKFEVLLENIEDEWLIGDSLRINQILMNLLSNAIKFTDKDGLIILKVTQVKTDTEEVFIKFEVSDTGIGMSKEYQKRLFQPFEQESALTAQVYGGTGLGLSISFNLINLMGGSIKVNSIQGQGSTFVVSLHFEQSKTKHENYIKDYSHLRALIIGSDKDNSNHIKQLLKRCGIKSAIVEDSNTAIRRIKSRENSNYEIDMCIVDLDEVSGIEVSKQIKSLTLKNNPIIVATAYDITEYEDEAKKIKIDKLIAKPLFQSTMFDLLVGTYGKYVPNSSEKKDISDIKGLRVLLAEDNAMNMEIACEILKKSGLIVECANDGKEAYEMFLNKGDSYDVILMDIQMPNMDGYQASKAIRSSNHIRAKTIPIIAMTANAFVEDVNAALASGMNGHVSKPINYDKLYEILNKFCDKKA